MKHIDAKKNKKLKYEKKIIFCDIDNTLFDTAELLKSPKNSFIKKMKLFVKPFNKIAFILKNKIKSKEYDIIFISHRNKLLIPISYFQLLCLGFYKFKLIHTHSVENKINIILDYINKGYDILYIDDLSYNHENGTILFYENVINEIKKLNIKYYDYTWIQKNK